MLREMKPCVVGIRKCRSVLCESFSAGGESCLGKLPDPFGLTWPRVSMASEMNQTVHREQNPITWPELAPEGLHLIDIALFFPKKPHLYHYVDIMLFMLMTD